MFNLCEIICLTLVACFCSHLVGAAGITNISGQVQAALDLELTKSLRNLQGSLKNGFKFNSIAEAHKFLQQCEYAELILGEALDNNKESLAATIREVLTEPTIAMACGVTLKELERKYAFIDEVFDTQESYAYLSANRVAEFEDLAHEIKQNQNLTILLTPFMEERRLEMGRALLRDATRDVAVICQDVQAPKNLFDIETVYKTGCEIKSLKPICKLARGTRNDDEMKNMRACDIEEFINVVLADEKTKIELNEAKSDVSIGEARSICNGLRYRPNLRAFKQIDNFLSLKYLEQAQVDQALLHDAELNLYYNINKLCNILKNYVT